MIKFKAWNASNSKAIAKFHNTEIGHFGHNAFIHELIRGSLIVTSEVYSCRISQSFENVACVGAIFHGD